MTHPLQTKWFDEAAEAEYLRQVEAFVHAGDLDIAAQRILDELEEMDTPLSNLCRELDEDAVELSGWAEIGDAIAQYEGEEPITAVHIVMSNEEDLVFEDKNITHHPDAEVVLYTDEYLPFSAMSRAELLTAALNPDPSWYGKSEDLEVYLELNGLSELNSALLRHKRQYHFRDQQHVLDAAEGLAADIIPLPYIEFRLCAMLRAIRFHQSVKSLLDGFGLSGKIPVIVGMHNMKIEFTSVYVPKEAKVVEAAKMPKLAVKIERNMEEDTPELTGALLRQKLKEEEPVEEVKVGFFRRLFQRKAA
ncbi:MAG: hypothetical protein HC843_07785 [Sphingomonadales bacterium]|nr:hypothetical protein [Sphingomonadales bacterium]